MTDVVWSSEAYAEYKRQRAAEVALDEAVWMRERPSRVRHARWFMGYAAFAWTVAAVNGVWWVPYAVLMSLRSWREWRKVGRHAGA